MSEQSQFVQAVFDQVHLPAAVVRSNPWIELKIIYFKLNGCTIEQAAEKVRELTKDLYTP